jgi:phosphatidate phosphatase APP1
MNSKEEVATWKTWDYLAKIITKHKLPGVPMLTLTKSKQINIELY